MEPKISVIIPVYKVEPYIRQSLDSVVGQTYKNLEIILVDDGSPDNCGAICDEYAQRDKRIKVIHKANGGPPAARNDALKAVTGEWISYVDPDDWCELDMYETAIASVREDDPDIVMFGVCREVGEKSHPIHPFPEDFVTEDKQIIEKLQLSAFNRRFSPICQVWSQSYPWDKLYRASMILGNGIVWPENVKANDDLIFNLHAFEFARKVAYRDKLLYHFRYNPTSIGNKYTPDREKIDEDIYREFMRIGEKYGKGEAYYQGVYVRMISNTVALGNRVIFNRQNKMSFIEKVKYLHRLEKNEIIYDVFESTDRKNLGYVERLATLNRHHNTVLRYVAAKLGRIKTRIGK